MNKSYYKTPKPGTIMKMMWKAAGADRYILERSTYSDHVKYACLGGIVVATGLMASLAGGYAFYIIFGQQTANLAQGTEATIEAASSQTLAVIFSILFGLIWGLIIFNIDRFIVASTGKGDGSEAITISEIKTAIPRILMGIIIAITISKPVELRMFQQEIEVELNSRRIKEVGKQKKEVSKLYEGDLELIQEEIIRLREDINKYETKRQEKLDILNIEVDGSGSIGGEGYGPVAKLKQLELELAKREYDSVRNINLAAIKIQDIKFSKTDSIMQKEIADAETSAKSLDGLMARLKIVDELAKGKDEDGNVNEDATPWIIIFITLLFMAIELTPIFFKMMLIKSPYDYLEDNIKALQRADLGIEVKYDYFEDREGVQRNLVIHHQANKLLAEKIKLAQTQTELNDFIIDKWKDEEKKNISKNPADFIDKS
jgi:hypothetical protein|tara:strand:+ start:2850 stop:4139 length:1290 start_codon:yes stop_codon:yes gene_type:complete